MADFLAFLNGAEFLLKTRLVPRHRQSLEVVRWDWAQRRRRWLVRAEQVSVPVLPCSRVFLETVVLRGGFSLLLFGFLKQLIYFIGKLLASLRVLWLAEGATLESVMVGVRFGPRERRPLREVDLGFIPV